MFEKAVNGVINQGTLSSRFTDNEATTNCYYRHPDKKGVKCAVGQLIDDKYYDASFDKSGIGGTTYMSRIDIQRAVSKSLGKTFTDAENRLLHYLQQDHDTSKNLHTFLDRVKRTAKIFDLKVDNITEVV